MDKKYLQGFTSAMKEENAIIKISRNKKNVRIVRINYEDGVDLVVTGSSLKNVLKKVVLEFQGKPDKQICVQGSSTNDNALDNMLKDHYIILSRATADDDCKNIMLSLFTNCNDIIFTTTSPIDRSAVALLDQAEEWCEAKIQSLN